MMRDIGSQERAAAYCNELKQSSECWQMCLEHFPKTQYAEVRFWCLQALLETIQSKYGSIPIASREQVIFHPPKIWLL
jgi:hypothetical protein